MCISNHFPGAAEAAAPWPGRQRGQGRLEGQREEGEEEEEGRRKARAGSRELLLGAGLTGLRSGLNEPGVARRQLGKTRPATFQPPRGSKECSGAGRQSCAAVQL